MSGETSRKDKLKTKDVITVVLLALINILVFGLSTFLYLTPITIVLMPVFFGLLEGIVFFIIGTKVRKRGAILIYCIVRGVIGVYLPYVALYLLSGVIAEIILWKTGYGSAKGLTLSFIILQVLAGLGSTIIPFTIAYESQLEMAKNAGDGRLDNIMKAASFVQGWGWVILILVIIAVSFVGAMIGKKVVKKHLAAVSEEKSE